MAKKNKQAIRDWEESLMEAEDRSDSLKEQLDVFIRIRNKPEYWPSASILHDLGCHNAAQLLEKADAYIDEAYKAYLEFYKDQQINFKE